MLNLAIGRVKDSRRLYGEADVLDHLRHGHFEAEKYLAKINLKSGRTVVGRVGAGQPYDHKSYGRFRGTIEITPEDIGQESYRPDYEVVRITEIESCSLIHNRRVDRE
jgi:hypothetical protein